MDGVHSVAQMGSIGQSSERRYKKPAASLRSGGPTQPVVPPSLAAEKSRKQRDRLPSLSLESQNVDKEDELPFVSSHQYQHLMLRPVITEGYRRRLLTDRQARDALGCQCWSRVVVRQNSRLPNPRVALIRLETPDSHSLWLAALYTGSTSPSRRSVILLLQQLLRTV
jgi:hypothetical protein